MWLHEADGQKEGFVVRFALLDPPHGLRSNRTIRQLIVSLGTDFEGRSLLGGLVVLACGAVVCGVRVLFGHHVVPRDDLLGPVVQIGIDGSPLRIPVRFIPGATVLKARVINLAQSRTVIAVRFEMLRKCDAIWLGHSEVCFQIPDFGRVGTQPGHDGCARRAAHGLLTIGSLEDDPASGDAIDVRRLHDRIAIAPEFRTQIIDRDKQHIRPDSASAAVASVNSSRQGTIRSIGHRAE